MDTASILSEFVVSAVEVALGIALLWMVGMVVLWAIGFRAKR